MFDCLFDTSAMKSYNPRPLRYIQSNGDDEVLRTITIS